MTQRIYCFDIGDDYVFRHYFDHTDLFDQLREYYDGENYRFEVPADAFEDVRSLLTEYGYEPVVADELEPYCVVKEQYTPHAEILKRSVIHWSRDGYNFFLLRDPQAVEYAIEQGAQRIEETNLVLGI